MQTKYVKGWIFMPCPHCRHEHGPFSQVTTGDMQCARCKTWFELVA